MLTSPVAAARAAVATGAKVKSKRIVSDTWKCGSLSFIFAHPPEDLKTKEKKDDAVHDHSAHGYYITRREGGVRYA